MEVCWVRFCLFKMSAEGAHTLGNDGNEYEMNILTCIAISATSGFPRAGLIAIHSPSIQAPQRWTILKTSPTIPPLPKPLPTKNQRPFSLSPTRTEGLQGIIKRKLVTHALLIHTHTHQSTNPAMSSTTVFTQPTIYPSTSTPSPLSLRPPIAFLTLPRELRQCILYQSLDAAVRDIGFLCTLSLEKEQPSLIQRK